MELIRKNPKVATFKDLKVGELFVFDHDVSENCRGLYTKEDLIGTTDNCRNVVDGRRGYTKRRHSCTSCPHHSSQGDLTP